MQQSFAYILNRRPFRDSSLLLDIFSEDYGRICCIARPAKKRGKVVKGHTEPFRYLHLQWLGKGDVQTLTEADERGRHNIPSSELMLGLYINELIMLFTQQHEPHPELFNAYKYTLHKVGDSYVNKQILMRFELFLLQSLDYSMSVNISPYELNNLIDSKAYFYFSKEDGLLLDEENNVGTHRYQTAKILISADLLLALQDIQNMQESHWKELRVFLDKVFNALAPRTINSRKLLSI
ncbi:MAG: DNA repair protein RecO (recombination protein O) [Cocleimonas sp.]|jgi:DNA repair protein RecO (recombination protein O)